eukprot:521632-Pleurochrysis_carterae.AAC.1
MPHPPHPYSRNLPRLTRFVRFKSKVYVIDVSQAVEHDHPNALVFLRKDCENTISFFRRASVESMPSLQQLFNFVTNPRKPTFECMHDDVFNGTKSPFADSTNSSAADGMNARASKDGTVGVPPDAAVTSETGAAVAATAAEEETAKLAEEEADAEAQVRERVFAQMHIPRTLAELPIKQMERELANGGELRDENSGAYSALLGIEQNAKVKSEPECAHVAMTLPLLPDRATYPS